jgi:hypothetical protein
MSSEYTVIVNDMAEDPKLGLSGLTIDQAILRLEDLKLQYPFRDLAFNFNFSTKARSTLQLMGKKAEGDVDDE